MDLNNITNCLLLFFYIIIYGSHLPILIACLTIYYILYMANILCKLAGINSLLVVKCYTIIVFFNYHRKCSTQRNVVQSLLSLPRNT